MQDGVPHQSVDKPDHRHFARHVPQALDVIVADEGSGGVSIHLLHLRVRLIKAFHGKREALRRDQARRDRSVDEIGYGCERVAIEGIGRGNDDGVACQFNRQQAVAAQEVARQLLFQHRKGGQVGLGQNGIPKVDGEDRKKFPRRQQTQFADDDIDPLARLVLYPRRAFDGRSVEKAARAQEIEQPARRRGIARVNGRGVGVHKARVVARGALHCTP